MCAHPVNFVVVIKMDHVRPEAVFEHFITREHCRPKELHRRTRERDEIIVELSPGFRNVRADYFICIHRS